MKPYRVKEFAGLAGVTVRTLHYYDQAGLLCPVRTNGERRYGEGDLLRLQQILTLKLVGFSLAEIRALLDDPAYDLRTSLRMQQAAVDRRIAQLQGVSRALRMTLAHLDVGLDLGFEQIAALIAALTGSAQDDWLRRYYPDGLPARFAPDAVDPAEVAAGTKAWADLYADFAAACALPPDHPDVQALAARMDDLISQFTQGDPDVSAALDAMYREPEQIPPVFRAMMPDDELQAFIDDACRIYQEHKR